jgi:hypothetical protein
MKVGATLLGGSGKTGIITPLVDVLFNLMITMFIFLMIYMIIAAPPKPKRPLHLFSSSLPAAVPLVDYFADVLVADGSSNFTFHFNAPGFSTNGVNPDEGFLQVSSTNRTLRGHFLASQDQTLTDRFVNLDVVVIDNMMFTSVPPSMVEFRNYNGTNLALFFHEKWTNASQTNQAADGTNRMSSRYAIQAQLPIVIKPKALPFNPAQNPLRMVGFPVGKGVVGIPFHMLLAPSGGVPPYEFDKHELPPWLNWDKETGSLQGSTTTPGIFEFPLRVKDAQTASNDWAMAELLTTNAGHPLVSNNIIISIERYEPLTAEFNLPPYSRIGESFKGSVLAKGGVGRRKFASVSMPAGLALNSDSGAISGVPLQMGRTDFVIVVSDEQTNSYTTNTSPDMWIGIIEPRPQPKIFGTPQ